jgi:hypothetical protein
MTILYDANLGYEVGTVLRRRAAQLQPEPPEWDELVSRPGPVVVPLPTVSAADDDDDRDRILGRRRPRPLVAAAAVVALALVGGFVVGRSGSGPTDVTQTPTSVSAASPTDAGFDAGLAPAVWASDLDDPVAAATSYLQAAGMAADPAVAAVPHVEVREIVDETVAIVDWSTVQGAASGGTVFLRNTAVGTAAPAWSVVGAAAEGVALEDVTYDGTQLAFTVVRTTDSVGELAASVWADGEPVPLDAITLADAAGADADAAATAGSGAAVAAADAEAGPAGADAAAGADGTGAGAGANADAGPVEADAVAGAGPDGAGANAGAGPVDADAGAGAEGAGASASVGQLLDVGAAAGARQAVTVDLGASSTASVRVLDVVDGLPLSVTEMAIALPDAATDTVAGSADVEADAEADAGSADEGGTAPGDIVSELPDGVEVPLPGGSEVTTPTIPPLPPLPSIPTTLLPPPPNGDPPVTLLPPGGLGD